MITQRTFLSGPASGICIVVAATAALFGSVAPGQAQVDPNIQTQANILSAPIVLLPLAPPDTPEGPRLNAALSKELRVAGPCRPTEARARKEFDRILGERPPNEKPHGLDTANAPLLTIYDKLSQPEKERARKNLSAPLPINFQDCHGQPTTLRASLVVNPTYETNALKTGVNGSSDGSFDAGGGLLVTTGLGETRPYDLIFLNMQTASARYATYSAKGIDTFTAQAGYQYLIDAYYYNDGKSLIVNKDNIPGNKAVTYDTVSFGFLNQTTYEPNFRKGTADLFTPQVTLGRQNFGLTDPTAPLCSPSSDWLKPTPTNPKPDPNSYSNFCYYLDLALTLGQSFSDVPTLQNANVAVSATLGKRFDGKDWTLAAQAIVTSRSYENVPGGRQDYLVQVGPVLSYSHAPVATSAGNLSFSFSLPVSYYQNYSNISKDAWSGIIVQPTFTIAFIPPPPPK
jgi:hypothetical protein